MYLVVQVLLCLHVYDHYKAINWDGSEVHGVEIWMTIQEAGHLSLNYSSSSFKSLFTKAIIVTFINKLIDSRTIMKAGLFVLSNTCFLWARTWKNHKCCINKVCIIMMSKSLSFCNPTQFKFWKIKYVFNTQSFIHICCPMENLSINDDQVHTLNYLRLCFRICPLNIPCVWNCFCLEPLQYITIKFWF